MPLNLCRRLFNWCKADKDRSLKAGVVAFFFLSGMIIFLWDYKVSMTEIQDGLVRSDYGDGAKTEELEVEVDGKDRSGIEITVSERLYTTEETNQMFRRCISKLEKEMLGNNESLDRVEKNLNLMTKLAGEPVEITWELDRYDVMNIYGELQEELDEEGSLVNLQAVLTYTEQTEKQLLYECTAMVYPKTLTQEEKIEESIKDAIRKSDEATRTEKTLKLPAAVGGKEVQYYSKLDGRGLVLSVMAVLVGVLLIALEKQKQMEEQKKRKQQLMLDYPEIVNKLTLFLGAGMTVKRAWKKIVADYNEQMKSWGLRYAYEEMKITSREMESGITEAESYERFGKRCGLQEYIRLGALLSQNLRKGTKGLSQLLRMEAVQAFEERKARAKRLGEEAGTKLLAPMFIMLAVVFVIVIVPAFLSMQI